MSRDLLHHLHEIDGWEFDSNRGWKKAIVDRLTVWARGSKDGPDITVVCIEPPLAGRVELWNDDVEFIHKCYVEVRDAWERRL